MNKLTGYAAVLAVGAALGAAPSAFSHAQAQPTNAQLLVWLKRIDSRMASQVQVDLLGRSIGGPADVAVPTVQGKLNRMQGEINSANLSLNKICRQLGISNIAC